MALTSQYFAKRAKEERAAAEDASSAEALKAHLELAFRYEQVAVELRFGGAALLALDHSSPQRRRSRLTYGRAELGRAVRTAFPLPTSGTFPDLLEAIDEADGKSSTSPE